MLHHSYNEEECADLEDVRADLDLVSIPKEVEEYARSEVGETEETKCTALSELSDMIYGEYPKMIDELRHLVQVIS